VLANVMRADAPPPSATAEGARPAAGPSYPISGDESTLAPHVGKKVQVTGTFESAAAAPGVSSVPKLKVASIKMVAESCS
jgi:hypothetical protein